MPNQYRSLTEAAPTAGAVGACPALALPVSEELTWLAAKLIPELRASRPDLTARRASSPGLSGEPMSDEWFAHAAATVAGLYVSDCAAYQRANKNIELRTTNPTAVADRWTLAEFSRVANLVFFQFCSYPYLVSLNAWAHKSGSGLSSAERRGVSSEAQRAGEYNAERRQIFIAAGTVTKVSAQLGTLVSQALSLGLVGPTRVRAELLAAGSSFADATLAEALMPV